MATKKHTTKKGSSKKWKIIDSKGKVIEKIEVERPTTYFIPSTSNVVNEPGLREPAVEGVLSYGQIAPMINYLGYNQQEIADVLEVDPSTLSRWRKGKDKSMGKLRSKTMYDIDHLIAKGVRIFGSEDAFSNWLNTSNYALGDKKPIELIKDPYHIKLVYNAVDAMSWGSFI